jgi:group I intron endonuclease
MPGIYKITNPNGKIYIGQSIDIKKRFYRYESLQCKGQPKLYNSIKKHGWENHITEIIEECLEEHLLEKETFWKIHYNVLNENSLCCRIDGRGGQMSEKSKKKMSSSIKKYWDEISDEDKKIRTKKNIVFLKSEGHVKTVSNRLKGVSKTKEHIIRLKESQNNKETVIKRKNSLRKYWDELDPNIREEKRQKNIEAQNREEVKKKISENNASKRPEVKEKQRQSALKRKKIECPHCNQFHDPGNSKKYHFDRCKFKFR